MCQGPAIHQHHSQEHLPISRLAVSAMPMSCQGWPVAREVSRRQIVESKVDLQTKQVAQVPVQLSFDPLFVLDQLVQGAVPLLELPVVDTDPWRTTCQPLAVVAPAGLPLSSLPSKRQMRRRGVVSLSVVSLRGSI